MPEISVITINYNNKAGLADTIASVLAQSELSIEYIVIDGGSSDGSVDVIDKQSKRLAYWVSEPDRGVYHAMNKGIAHAKGRYVTFLNSGDIFHSADVLQRLLAESCDRDIVYGDVEIVQSDRTLMWQCPDILTFKYFRTDSIPHPASLIRRSLFRSIHPYDEQFRIVSDWAFFAEAICLHGATYVRVAFPVAIFKADGISSRTETNQLHHKERDLVLQNKFAAFVQDYIEWDRDAAALRSWFARIGRKVDRVLRRAGITRHMGGHA